MNLWQQNYDPAGNIWLSSLIASLPILFFFFALIKLKLKGYIAATPDRRNRAGRCLTVL